MAEGDAGPEDFLDASANPARGLGFRQPDRLEQGCDVVSSDLVYRQGHQWTGIHLQRTRPLCRMLRVAPDGLASSDEGARRLLERRNCSPSGSGVDDFSPRVDRVNSS